MSPLTTNCPHCKASLEITQSRVGRTVRCPKCGDKFDVRQVDFGEESTDGEALRTRDGGAEDGAESDGATETRTTKRRFGRFEITSTLGKGGFGVVYKARDTQMDREVALKVPKFGRGEKRKVRRFLAEARTAAKLRHPNIVPVFDNGEVDGKLFIAAEFVPGETLAAKLKGERRPDRETVVEWVRELAEALAYAHDEGVVHRDVKPDNVIVDDRGRPQLMDFGLAKRLDEDSSLSVDGSVLGTPSYMAPEQARGELTEVGPHSDQYALGVVLYELLTGERPFHGPPHAVVALVASDEEPRPPRGIDPTIPHDLEAICLKAMAKDPGRRYETTDDLAADLQDYLDGETTRARPVGPVERLRRWCRRNPVLALSAAAGTVVAVLVVVLAVALGYQLSLESALERSREAEAAAKEAVGVAEAERLRAEQAEGAASVAREELDRTLAAERIRTATELLTPPSVDVERARIQLDAVPESHRNFEWRYLDNRQAPRVVTSTRSKADHSDVDDVRCVDVSHDGLVVACGLSSGNVRLRDARTGDVVRQWSTVRLVESLAFSPDGRRLVTAVEGGEGVKVWDTATGRLVVTLKSDDDRLQTSVVRFSPDGRRVVSAHDSFPGGNQHVRLWDAATGNVVFSIEREAIAVCVHPERPEFLVCGEEEVSVWSTLDGKKLRGFDFRGGPYHIVSVSPDGRLVALGRDDVVHVYDWDSGFRRFEVVGHGRPVHSLDFDKSGTRLATIAFDDTVRVWHAGTGKPVLEFECKVREGNRGWAPRIRFADYGTRLVCGSAGGIDTWQIGLRDQGVVVHDQSAPLTSLRFSPDGTRIVTGDANGSAKMFDANSFEELDSRDGNVGKDEVHVCFDPDGTHLACAGSEGVRAWRIDSGEETLHIERRIGRVQGIEFSPDGRRLLANSGGHTSLWDSRNGNPIRIPWIGSMCDFSPDGETIAGCTDYRLRLWNDSTGQIHHEPGRQSSYDSELEVVAYSQDGEFVVGGDSNGWLFVWNIETGECVDSVDSHIGPVRCLAFSPDGSRVVSGGEDGMVRLWDPALGREVLSLRGHRGPVSAVRFTKDGRRIVSAGRDGRIHVWDSDNAPKPRRTQKQRLAAGDGEPTAKSLQPLPTHGGGRRTGPGARSSRFSVPGVARTACSISSRNGGLRTGRPSS